MSHQQLSQSQGSKSGTIEQIEISGQIQEIPFVHDHRNKLNWKLSLPTTTSLPPSHSRHKNPSFDGPTMFIQPTNDRLKSLKNHVKAKTYNHPQSLKIVFYILKTKRTQKSVSQGSFLNWQSTKTDITGSLAIIFYDSLLKNTFRKLFDD